MTTKSSLGVKYISEEGLVELSRYQYHGSDHSLLYKYWLKPMAAKLANLLPEKHIHPNVVTLMGLTFCCITLLIFAIESPTFEKIDNRAYYAVAGVFLFLYQTFDNMDGHQARRTGLSSPLGQLMDHGCDALNATVSALPMIVMMQVGTGWKAFAVLMIAHFPFWFTTWEEWHTHYLYLAPVNGPSEGLVGSVILYFVTAAYGPEFWTIKITDGLLMNDLVVILTGAMAVLTVCGSLYNVSVAMKKNEHGRSVSAGTALVQCTPFFILWGSVLATILADSMLPKVYPWAFYTAQGFFFALLVCRLILSHLTKQPYVIFNWLLLCPVFMFLNLVCSDNKLNPWIPEIAILSVYFVGSLGAFFHYAVHVSKEIANHLDIPILTVPAGTALLPTNTKPSTPAPAAEAK
eukprot:GFYU01013562.1.p1 GENE.GFYU01013562.1~~GFYU01013562.1.p1  ORF type:complete len:405 (+),score=124.81 GFYU01013562.1:120-1334(+)